MKAQIFIEGGANKDIDARCRAGFGKLLEKAGFGNRMPKLTPSGSRESTFSDFKQELPKASPTYYVGMLIDSEDPVADTEKPWEHLRKRDQWDRPEGASDDQVLFMTTCMETWVAADRAGLRNHYGQCLQENALPPIANLEDRRRHDVHDSLTHATRTCKNAYAKGKRSFQVIEALSPEELNALPSFARAIRILNRKLPTARDHKRPDPRG